MASKPGLQEIAEVNVNQVEIETRRRYTRRFNPKIRKRKTFPLKMSEMVTKHKVPELDERSFQKAFLEMKAMVEVIFQERKERKKKKEGKARKKEETESSLKEKKGKGVGGGGDPPKTPFPSSSSSSSSSSAPSNSSKKKQPVQTNTPLLKLDVKFYLPIYNG